MGGVPSVPGGGASRRQELHGGVVTNGVDVDAEPVTRSPVGVELAGVFEPDLHRGVRGAAVVVHHLAEPDVAPGEAVRVVEARDRPDLPGLVGVETPAEGGAGPSLTPMLLVNHDRPAEDGLVAEEAEVGVVVNFADVLHIAEEAVLAAQIAHFILISRPASRFRTISGVPIIRVKMASDSLSCARKFKLILNGNLKNKQKYGRVISTRGANNLSSKYFNALFCDDRHKNRHHLVAR